MILLVLLILLLFYTIQPEPFVSGVTPQRKHMLPKHHRESLLNALRHMHDIFQTNGVQYCIEGGTLLGAVRHRGLIPWDDDADVMVLKEDQARIMSLRQQFRDRALDVTQTDHPRLLRIYCNAERFPFIDLLLYKRIDTEFQRCLPRDKAPGGFRCDVGCCRPTQNNKSWKWWYTHIPKYNDIFPLRLYKFEDFVLYGPRNPQPYLVQWYGKDYMTDLKVTHNHSGAPI